MMSHSSRLVVLAVAFFANVACLASQAAPSWNVVLDVAPDPAIITDASIRARIVATGSPWRVREISSGIEMLLIPPGTFMMGASVGDADATAAEQPAHEVTKMAKDTRAEMAKTVAMVAMEEMPGMSS